MTNVSDNRRVLIVDDQQEIHDDFAEMLSQPEEAATDWLASAFVATEKRAFLPRFELLHAGSGEEGCEIVRRGWDLHRPVAVAYIDIRMPPGMDGVETIRRMRKTDPNLEAVIMTAYTDRLLPEIVGDMQSLHKLLYIRKPFAREEIQQITLCLVKKWNVEQELAQNREQLIASNQRLEAVLNATGEAMAMYDRTERLVFANGWYEKLIGATKDELLRMSPPDIAAHFKRRFREPKLTDKERQFITAGGESVLERIDPRSEPVRRLYYRRRTPVRDGEGAVIGDLYVYGDVSKELEVERMKVEVARLRSTLTAGEFPGIVGTGTAMQRMYGLMHRAIEGNITVLITGESGTGKELIARAIHARSSRRKGPFLAINCAAVPEALIESELFGHEAGAFTGAERLRIGSFERADGGTILLDEIGDMHPALQTRLLRVLQEREIQRVGGTAGIPVDVRVIAATNSDIEAAVREGAFREDLFYRIAAFPITVPPLRERSDDIPVLAQHFVQKQAAVAGKAITGISSAALRLLLQHEWPGNVRELENAIGRAVLLETTDVLQASSLPPRLAPLPAERGGGEAGSGVVPTLAEAERHVLRRTLTASAGNVAAAAQTLGVDRATLYRKLKRHGLSARDWRLPS